MKSLRAILMAIGLLYGASDLALAADVNFKVTDVPGHWFDTCFDDPLTCSRNQPTGTRSLHIVAPGTKINFLQNINGKHTAESRHTVTSLLWPSTALPSEKIDQAAANQDNHFVTLTTPGLYVYVCKLHPYMLGGVIVDDATTKTTKGDPAYDIGNQLTLLVKREVTDSNLTFDSNSNLGLRLLRAFFLVTNPSNWKDYTKVGEAYKPAYPAVPVVVTGGAIVPDLNAALQATFDGDIIPAQKKPSIKGVGEVWVDTQFELSEKKGPSFPGTASVVEVDALLAANNWKVKRKIALPDQKMNNGHNLWPSHDQKKMYQTEWHGHSLFVLDRVTGAFLQELEIGNDPAHVMTRVDTQQVHVGLNGEDGVMELNRDPGSGLLTKHRVISMQDPAHPTKQTQPHAHWMGFDGGHMVTPNSNSADSTLYEFTGFNTGKVLAKHDTGAVSIAAGMMPDSSKYYVSNYLGHSISVMNGPVTRVWHGKRYQPGEKIKDINLLQGYDPKTGCGEDCVDGLIGGLPVQVPVSPDGKFAITGNTLGGTISIVDTATDTLVRLLHCDPGCHGVNFGAKKGGGYYAYVTPKFANRLLVVDYDPNNDGKVDDAVIAGWVILANDEARNDDEIAGNRGMGAQGVMPVPTVYNGWVQELPAIWKIQLTKKQRHPIGQHGHDHEDDQDHDDDHK